MAAACKCYTGKCTGNTGGQGDVTCDSGTQNKGAAAIGTTKLDCCSVVAVSVTGKCTGNTLSKDDVTCVAPSVDRVNKGSIPKGSAVNQYQTVCCHITGKCTGNTVASTDVTCPDSNTVNRGSTVAGTTTTACCHVTGKCTGNTVAAADVTCPDSNTVNRGSTATGTTTTACCHVTGKCTGNTVAAADVKCVASNTVNRGSTVAGTTTDACCHVTGKCTGNTGAIGDVSCASGDGTTSANTQNKGITVEGNSTEDCCEAVDVTGKCTGNTKGTGDVTCVAPNTVNKGSGFEGSTKEACCKAPAVAAAGCANACTKMPGDYANTLCDAVASGTEATCTPKASDSLQAHCMGPTFKVKCPKNNGGSATLPFLQATSVACQACSVMALGADKNPQPNKYQVTLSWGKNMKTGSASAFWQRFDGYKIIIVDADGKKVGSPDNGDVVPVKTASTEFPATCCSDKEYTTTVSGDQWPASGKKFMIVPYDDYKVTVAAKDGVSGVIGKRVTEGRSLEAHQSAMSFTMPMGAMTTQFVDAVDGTATVIKVAPVMQMSETAAKDIMALPKAEKFEVGRQTVHAGLKAKGVKLKNIIVKNVEIVKPARRLGSTRNLAAHMKGFGIKITSEILLDQTYTGGTIDTASIDKAAMTTTFVKQANAVLPVAKQIKAADVAVDTSSLTVVTEDISVATPVTGAARPMAGTIFSTVIALAMALTGHQLLA